MNTRHLAAILLLLAAALPCARAASQRILPAPPGSQSFGQSITALPNGNFVVVDVGFDLGPGQVDVGAVYLYSPDGVLISRLTGSTTGDQVGMSVTVLASGNFVVCSPFWDNGAADSAGAATWGSAATGFIGGPLATVSAANSLVGTTANDFVGLGGATVLANGHYVIASRFWDHGSIVNAGAVTWCNGFTGRVGAVSPTNSLVGGTNADEVGTTIRPLSNGHYVVLSPFWDHGLAANAGAATWGNGNGGTTGLVLPANSLVGTFTDDNVGSNAVALNNGHYVVVSHFWKNGLPLGNFGAVTWGNGNSGITGPVSAANSLVGTTTLDRVGGSGVIALSNGHYVVCSQNWANGPIANAGAATWGNGNGGTTGPVSPANSLVGTTANDQVGNNGATALANGHYVVGSTLWDNGPIVNAGAATWGNGNGGTAGPVSAANSLVGTTANDRISLSGITALANGHYVVCSELWDNGTVVNAGAATWGNGNGGTTGPVSPANSLVGSTLNDNIGQVSAIALVNGHYVVRSPNWNRGSIVDAGALTWCPGGTGRSGSVSEENSLVGTSNGDGVGGGFVLPLANGHYATATSFWDNGPIANAGAVTWGNGFTGTFGPVTPANSLVGTQANDRLGDSGLVALPNGGYFVRSPLWDNGSLTDAGAITLLDGSAPVSGVITPSNSVLGETANAFLATARHLATSGQIIVGSPVEGRIILFGNRPVSLALLRGGAPGRQDLTLIRSGPAAVSASGTALFDATLSGPGAAKGRNRAVFATAIPGTPVGLVLLRGDNIAALGGGLPANATVNALLSPLHQTIGRGLFQVTVQGAGLTNANNRLLLRDTGNSLLRILRTGQPHHLYGPATYRSFTEVLQSHKLDLITVTHRLNAPASQDSGVTTFRHHGAPSSGGALPSQEGKDSMWLPVGILGQFGPRAAATLGGNVSFLTFSLNIKKPALMRISDTGNSIAGDAVGGNPAPGIPGATHRSFPAFTQLDNEALYKTILAGVPKNVNEALYRGSDLAPRLRKGDSIGGGVTITAIVRFWPAGLDQLIALVRLSDKTQALLLRQSDGQLLLLARTKQTMPGTGSAQLRTITSVDVNPGSGRYAILGSLSGTPASANQALWTGNASLGADTPASQQALRLPILRLRKGDVYSTAATPLATIKSMLMQPAIDPGGAGGRGLHHAIGTNGSLALTLTTLANNRHLVLLPP